MLAVVAIRLQPTAKPYFCDHWPPEIAGAQPCRTGMPVADWALLMPVVGVRVCQR
jgi:hypothetical protein